ncbi:DUF805 domain-containing protein [Modestobacter versicolor]|uniref:DUF805 domain-containing protein n=1 Tax=Modestobacter versicolor TaxID=429133 RepID=UPI0034DE5203
MTFWQWYVRRGRIDRRTWWLQYTVPLAVLSALALAADLALGNRDLAAILDAEQGFGPVFQAVTLLATPATVSASATRLHDRGMSAWWLLLAFVPVFGQVALLVLNGFLPGDPRPNAYGPPPSWAEFPAPVQQQPLLPPPAAPPSGPPTPPPSAPPYWG